MSWFLLRLSCASTNTARSFGPVLVSGKWTAHWAYWMGPIVGAEQGAFVYELVRRSVPEKASF